MIKTFEQIGLKKEIVDGLRKQSILEPTQIQSQAIQKIVEGKDLVCESETGSGKTLAYVTPLFQKIDTSKRENQAIILAPTHELAVQINTVIKTLAEKSGMPVTSQCIIGKVNIKRQVEGLRNKPHIIVGSSGRILELILRKKIKAHTVKTIVVDEGDRLLDINNLHNIQKIIKSTLLERQVLVFSATITQGTLKTCRNFMKEPEFIRVKRQKTVNGSVNHLFIQCQKREQVKILRKILNALPNEKFIAFVNKPENIDIVTSKLRYHNISVSAISGKDNKEERKNALLAFRQGKSKILISSDVSARGLDIKDVTHIINLDIPENPDTYVHRAGRTGRAGKKGTVISLVDRYEYKSIKNCSKKLNLNIPEKIIYKGEFTAPRKDDKE